jgi:hypothetical protein
MSLVDRPRILVGIRLVGLSRQKILFLQKFTHHQIGYRIFPHLIDHAGQGLAEASFRPFFFALSSPALLEFTSLLILIARIPWIPSVFIHPPRSAVLIANHDLGGKVDLPQVRE